MFADSIKTNSLLGLGLIAETNFRILFAIQALLPVFTHFTFDDVLAMMAYACVCACLFDRHLFFFGGVCARYMRCLSNEVDIVCVCVSLST